MQKLKAVKISKVILTKKYLVSISTYEPYEGGGSNLYTATGKEVIKAASGCGTYKEWLKDEEKKDTPANFKKFLKSLENANGDGCDFVEVFEIRK